MKGPVTGSSMHRGSGTSPGISRSARGQCISGRSRAFSVKRKRNGQLWLQSKRKIPRLMKSEEQMENGGGWTFSSHPTKPHNTMQGSALPPSHHAHGFKSRRLDPAPTPTRRLLHGQCTPTALLGEDCGRPQSP